MSDIETRVKKIIAEKLTLELCQDELYNQSKKPKRLILLS